MRLRDIPATNRLPDQEGVFERLLSRTSQNANSDEVLAPDDRTNAKAHHRSAPAFQAPCVRAIRTVVQIRPK